METELEKLRLENEMLKAKLKKKRGNKVQQVKRWRENNRDKYVAQKKRKLERRKEKRRRKNDNAEEKQRKA